MHRTSRSVLAPRRLTVAAALTALVVLLVGASQALASVTVQHSVTPFSFAVTSPCDGAPGTLSGTETASTRIVATDNHLLIEGSARTDETFTPDDPAAPPATGHGTFNFHFVANAGGATTVYGEVQTDVFHAPGATVVVHHVVHTTVVDGEMIVSIDRPLLVCQGR